MADIECAIDSGDIAWVLVGSALILSMMPGLAIFEAGLLRSKNTLSLMMQVLTGIVVCSVMWIVMGYSLVFGSSTGGFIGNFDNFFYRGVSNTVCSPHAVNIPAGAFAVFEMMFANICPLLITGAYAERMRGPHSLVFSALWSIFVYYPVAHWVWGGGWLQRVGVQDFAGGIVLHTTAGSAALVVALFLGRRKGFHEHHGEFPPSNLPLAMVGAAQLWLGWFFFNGASALSANNVAVSAVLSTQIGASVSGLVYYIFSSLFHKKPSLVATLNGLIAGMAGITPASGFIDSTATIGVGAVLGLTFWGCVFLKEVMRIDDALDVSIVHGLTGAIGSIALGFVASKDENSASANGLFYGGDASFLGYQAIAVFVCAMWSVVWTTVILFVMNRISPVRISKADEEDGLDLMDHGEFAYHQLRLRGREPLFESLLAELDESSSESTTAPDTSIDASLNNDRPATDDDDDDEADRKTRLLSKLASKRTKV